MGKGLRGTVDVEALALERYPGEWQGPERSAFIDGFMLADPAKAIKKPGRKRIAYGERSALFRAMEIGESKEIPLVDGGDYGMWRSTASYLKGVYGCIFKVERNDNKLLITRTR